MAFLVPLLAGLGVAIKMNHIGPFTSNRLDGLLANLFLGRDHRQNTDQPGLVNHLCKLTGTTKIF